jgi:hypothetical protein
MPQDSDRELEQSYAVATHLEASESIGPIPHRVAVAGVGAWVASSMLVAGLQPTDELLRQVVQWGPVVLAAPFGPGGSSRHPNTGWRRCCAIWCGRSC